jgi:hypothetical protein
MQEGLYGIRKTLLLKPALHFNRLSVRPALKKPFNEIFMDRRWSHWNAICIKCRPAEK